MTNRRGFSLIEIMCVMVLLVVIGAIVAVLLRETLEVERLQAEGFEKALQANALADRFRADVAHAESAPKEWLQFKADTATLILHSKEQGHIVYAWRDAKLDRHAFEGEKVSERNLPVGGGRVGIEFVPAGPDTRLIRLRLHALRDGRPVPGQSLEIAAALGGDRR